MAKSAYRKMEATRAAIYARVSDKSQDAEDKTSISEQIYDMEAHCERRGLTIVARYQEVGRGWSKKRPEFQRMLADARQGRFDTIVCWKSDRLSRGMYPAAALMEVIEAHRINLEAVMDAIDMKTFGLMAAVGKIELDNFRERSSMGKRGSAKQGRIPIGNVPYGYRVGEDGRPEIVESEAEVVRRIYRMYVNEGKGAPAITRQLNAEGVQVAASAAVTWRLGHWGQSGIPVPCRPCPRPRRSPSGAHVRSAYSDRRAPARMAEVDRHQKASLSGGFRWAPIPRLCESLPRESTQSALTAMTGVSVFQEREGRVC